MTFFAFGLNHETSPLSVREAFALNVEGKRQLLRRLRLSEGAEIVLLSTCNRTEAYLHGLDEDVTHVQQSLAGVSGHEWPSQSAFRMEDEEAVVHVLRVASGLRSMVVGDAQIIAQMKEAYGIAVQEERVGTVLHRLMHTAFRAAKRVASETAVGTGSASVSSAAVTMARSHFRGSLASVRMLLVGTGEVGRLVLKALKTARPSALSITNRSTEHAAELSARYGASIVPWEQRHQAVSEADLVLVATGAQDPVLDAGQLPDVTGLGRQVLVLDLGVPRNADPEIAALPGYSVVDMDALASWTRRVEAARRLEVPKAEALVAEELAEFVSWMFHHEALQPAIEAVRDTFEQIRAQEIERHGHRFKESDRAQLDALTRSIMQKLLAVPIVRLKAHDPESVDLVRGVRLLQSFFSRPDCEDGSAGDQPPGAEHALPDRVDHSANAEPRSAPLRT